MHLAHTLRHLATAQSFERGEDYYASGMVSKLVKKGHEYEAEVDGSRTYRQYVNMEEGFSGTCTCPYSFGGICKHLVAVGLAIEEEEFTEVLIPEEEIAEELEQQAFFTDLFEQTDTADKLSFLRKLLEKNSQIRNQFTAFISAQQQDVSKINLDVIRQEMEQIMREIDFSEDNLNELSNYRETWYEEGWEEDLAQSVLEELFESFEGQLVNCLQKGDIEDALRVLLGMYEGFCLIREAPGDEDGYIDDFAELVWDQYEGFIDQFITCIEETVIATAQLKRMQDLWFQRWDYYEKTFDINKPESSIRYDLLRFTPLLLSLANDEVSLHYLDMRAAAYGLESDKQAAFLLLGISERQEDKKRWLSIAERFAGDFVEIGRLLLIAYWEMQEEQLFTKLAGRLYKRYPEELGEYLATHFFPELDEELYKQILKEEIDRRESIDLYKKWRLLISEKEKQAFIQALRDQDYQTKFLIEVLASEGNLEEIRDLAQEKHNTEFSTYAYNPMYMLQPIRTVYPDFCFHLLADTIAKTVEVERGRTAYQKICHWLSFLTNIPGFESQSQVVVQECYRQRLPALKDEMRRAGLV